MGRIVRFSCATAALLFAAPLAAQAAPDEQAETTVDGDIIVTAQKRAQRLQDVPISIAVQEGGSLERQGLNTFLALQSRVPNLSITDTPANASIFIRGIGTSGNNLSFEQSVALFVDQIYGGRNRQFMQPFFDVERIEVLRGPQGALFGRNTSAGAISVITRRPTQEFEGRAFVDYEFVRGSPALELAAGGGVTDTLSVRFAGRYNRNVGWLDNIVLDRKEPVADNVIARGSLLWEPADNASLFVKAEYNSSDIIGAPFEFVPGGTRPDYKVDTDDAFKPLADRSDAFSLTGELNLGLGSHTLTAIGAYTEYQYEQAFNIQARRPARLVVANDEVFDQYSTEVRIASPADPNFDYIVGAYAEKSSSTINRINFIDLPPPPVLNQDNRRRFIQDSNVVAVFGQVNWRFLDQFRLGAGLRWQRITKSGFMDGVNQTFLPNGAVQRTPRTPQPLAARFSDRSLEPTVTLSWEPNPDVNIYARYAEGSKGGAVVEAALTQRDFILQPEDAKSYEAGAKFSFPAVRGFLNIAVFSTDYTNLQKSSLDINTATFVVSNAAGARTRGIEVDAAFAPADWLRVSVAGAYLDAKYTDYPNGPCRFTAPAGCTQQDRTGDRLQNAPEFTGNIVIDVNRPLGGNLRLLGNWITNYQSRINFQDTLDPREEQEGFTKTDVRVALAHDVQRWELGLLVRNLFDRRTSGLIFNVFPVGVGPNDRAHMPDPRRSVTVQARVFF
jgi:iron complex outermembrane recepter protein